MSKIRRAAALASIVFVAASPRLAAQTGPLADSAMKLVRAGLYDQATHLAIRGVAETESNDERCGLMFATLFALTRQGQYDTARQQFRTYDQQCTPLESSQQYLNDLDILRLEWSMPPIPRSGSDFSGLDRFWGMVDTLTRGIAPSSHLWRGLLGRPAYRLVLRGDDDLERQIDIAFRPSHAPDRDSLTRTAGRDSAIIAHLIDAGKHRAELVAVQKALETTIADTIAAAVRNASRFLPPNTVTARRPAPFVGFALFFNERVAQDEGFVLDLLDARTIDLTAFLSREFYQRYVTAIAPDAAPPNETDGLLYHAIRQLRNEGIGDMTGTPYPLKPRSAGDSVYAASYNAAYARTPMVLRSLDSLLAAAYEQPADRGEIGTAAQQLLVDDSRPNGAYMAREVLDTYGADSLVAAATNPFRFIRMFTAAEQQHGHPAPFSAKAVAMLDVMEKRWVR